MKCEHEGETTAILEQQCKKCGVKRMQSVMKSVVEDVVLPVAQPYARETTTIFQNGKRRVVYKDDMKKQMLKSVGMGLYR
ncbi:MAG TPA: hypothetical protein H9983_05230 [Candidatus Kurthia intestinigallinarum]|nr:hypothetical protein [Candidatus Kurthia intestinigallinarum]